MDLGLEPIIAEIRQERDALRARIAELERENARADRDHVRTIEERDEVLDAFDELVVRLGIETEYSNLRSVDDVLSDAIDRITEMKRECAGLAAVVAKIKAIAHPRNIPFAPRLEGWDALAALYQKYLLYLDHVHTDAGIVYASAIHDLIGSLPDPSAALARYRDGVLEEVAKRVRDMDLSPIPSDTYSKTISECEDVIRAMKGAK